MTQPKLFTDMELQRQCDAAMARIVAHINRCAGQQLRRWLEAWGYRP